MQLVQRQEESYYLDKSRGLVMFRIAILCCGDNLQVWNIQGFVFARLFVMIDATEFVDDRLLNNDLLR